ncbi:MAG: hypothetical protein AAF564_02810 [Bacteroidota bacterium]
MLEDLRKLYPNKSEEELKEAAENLEDYARLLAEIWLKRRREKSPNSIADNKNV